MVTPSIATHGKASGKGKKGKGKGTGTRVAKKKAGAIIAVPRGKVGDVRVCEICQHSSKETLACVLHVYSDTKQMTCSYARTK